MTPDGVFMELLELAESVALTVRFEAFATRNAGPGGLCKLGGAWVLLVNESAPVADRVVVVADALAPLEVAAERLSAEAHQALSRARRRRIPVTQGAERRRETEAERALRTGVHLKGVVRAGPRRGPMQP